MQHYGSIEQKGRISVDLKNAKDVEQSPTLDRFNELQSLKEHRQDRLPENDNLWGTDGISKYKRESLGAILTSASTISNTDSNLNDQNDRRMHKWMLWLPEDESFRRKLWMLLAVIILIPTIFHLCRGDESFIDFSNGTTSNFIYDTSYDYIVVGGGPAGILVATELARKLGSSYKILLLEAGTISQSSVMENVYRKQMDDLVSASDHANSKPFSMSPFSSFPQLLNQMDIPILWSGVASKATHLGNQTATTTNAVSDDFHHWHVPKTLLAKALGGCGVHNAMLYVRALRTDFEKWNMTGWSSDLLFQYYQKLESFVDHPSHTIDFGPDTNQDSHKTTPKTVLAASTSASATFQRGTNGPIRSHPAGPVLDTIGELFRQSCAHVPTIGLASSQGFNHPNPSARIGAGLYEFNIRNGVRDSVAKAFLGDHRQQSSQKSVNTRDGRSHESGIPKNLDILLGASVTRVLTKTPKKRSGTGLLPQTMGVEFLDEEGHLHQVMLNNHDASSRSEVILSCGAIMTPQVLSNSGIGENGSVVDLPGVGKNLQDHPVIPVLFRLTPNMTDENGSTFVLGQQWQSYLDGVQTLRMEDNDASNLDEQTRQDLLRQIGTMGTAGFSTGAFLKSPWAKDEAPDLQLTVFPRSVEPHVVDKAPQSDQSRTISSSTMLVTIALLDADARYEVKPSRSTMIDQNSVVSFSTVGLPSIVLPRDSKEYLSDMDVRRLQWGVEQLRRVQQTPPLQYYTQEEVVPGVGIDLEQYIRSHHLPNSHWTGSTKMGHDDDPLAVVDETLRVRNINGLRIVDAGVMPTIPNGNTHSAVTVVASRAVDLIQSELDHLAK